MFTLVLAARRMLERLPAFGVVGTGTVLLGRGVLVEAAEADVERPGVGAGCAAAAVGVATDDPREAHSVG